MDTRNKPFTVPMESVRQPPKIEIAQEPFYLMEVDFYHLTKGRTKPAQLGIAIFLTSIGYLLILIAKLTATHIFDKPTPIEAWEWLAVIVGGLAGVIIYGLACLLPCESTAIKKEIRQHFQNSPRARQLPRDK